MNLRMNERNRLKRKMASLKRQLITLANKLNSVKGYDARYGLIIWIVEDIESVQRQINALSADVDEKALLEQSLKRAQKAKRCNKSV